MSEPRASTSLPLNSIKGLLWVVCAITVWQWLPDRYMGPFNAWNPHAIMEFVVTIFSIAWLGHGMMRVLGAHNGVLLAGLMGGFASSTATIHTMGALAKLRPELAERAAVGGVLSNLATLLQLGLLLKLLAPELWALFLLPLCWGMAAMCAYAMWVLFTSTSMRAAFDSERDDAAFDWRGLITLTALVCAVSYVSAWLNASYGQNGLWFGAAVSGLVDAHAIVPTVASLLTQQQLQPHAALIPVLTALTANTFTKSLLALQSGGWAYAQKVGPGVWLTTGAVWIGYLLEKPIGLS